MAAVENKEETSYTQVIAQIDKMIAELDPEMDAYDTFTSTLAPIRTEIVKLHEKFQHNCKDMGDKLQPIVCAIQIRKLMLQMKKFTSKAAEEASKAAEKASKKEAEA